MIGKESAKRMKKSTEDRMGKEPLLKLITSLSLPVMFAMLVQSLYNIVDSVFVARYSEEGLTALSLAFPLQLLLTAVATGTGVGINALVSRRLGEKETEQAGRIAEHGVLVGLLNWMVFALIGVLVLKPYFMMSTSNPSVISMGCSYTYVILIFSVGIFVESNCSKILQATGNMVLPMAIQMIGALLNLILDPLLIFGYLGFPEMGVTGAAVATVIGQLAAMAVSVVAVMKNRRGIILSVKGFRWEWGLVKAIYQAGLPSIVMQALYTVYIIGLNLILVGFSEAAVTVLGIYYKLQTFLFIPFEGFLQATMPIMSYNYGAGNKHRLWLSLKYCCLLTVVFLGLGAAVFWVAPAPLLGIFSHSAEIMSIGVPALRIIALSFIPLTFSLQIPSFFQAVGFARESIFLTILRQIVLLVPVAFVLSHFGLFWVWFTFPITELITTAAGFFLLRKHKRGMLSIP